MKILSKIKFYYYAVEFFLGVIVVVFFMWILPNKRHRARQIWATTQRYFGFYKIEIIGKPADDINIVLMNHQSMLDIVCMEEIYPRNLCWIAKKEISKLPVLGKIITLPKMISIDRKNPRSLAIMMKEAKERLQEGRVIAIFPEGTRNQGDSLLNFQNGAKMLIDKLNLKAQPVIIIGSGILNYKKKIFNNGIIKIIYLDPIDTNKENWWQDLWQTMNDVFQKHSLK